MMDARNISEHGTQITIYDCNNRSKTFENLDGNRYKSKRKLNATRPRIDRIQHLLTHSLSLTFSWTTLNFVVFDICGAASKQAN